MRKCSDCRGPNFGLGQYCAKCRSGAAPVAGMVRNPDHATSVAAAEGVEPKRPTIRQRVLHFAEQEPHGFIDHDLLALEPNAAESSFRKRRTELVDEGLIVATGSTRRNRNGEEAVVFVHRKYHASPPPVSVKPKGKSADALRKRKREIAMFNALVMAAPHHQGASSRVGAAIAAALEIPHPIEVTNIPALRTL